MRDAATMHPIDAASRGSTRLLEYLSCDGSLSGGGGAFVPDCRRSIIPRLYDLLLLSGWGLAGLIPRVYRCCFAFPSPVWSGRAARVEPTGAVLEAEERLSLNNSCGTRDVYRLPQAIFLPRPCLGC